MRISIIIPTLNESDYIAATLYSARRDPDGEVIVADGGSRDGTVALARALGARVIMSPAGRAWQMNAGAAVATGDVLLFLHADTRLPANFAEHVRTALDQPGVAAGAFELRIDAERRGLRIIERSANWRSRRLQMPYGDQAIFLRADRFREVGGFQDIPIMEDLELIQRLRRQGRISIVPVPVTTSARRWLMLGIWRTTWINQRVLLAYYWSMAPTRLARWYDRNQGVP
ncbi:MAG: TIGR04283 family arsenosugar biosynthesis glycosyltransferase [Acidobacteria bacterium]|nr:TIGR04283 family arsenosugar biosynthesis glycosyltransferase [Acidobacteriota bacterium]